MISPYIRLVEFSCHNCMRCVRACPTNAMTYTNSAPQILAEECILCGNCYKACPHDAKSILSEMDRVLEWLKEGKEVILSVAPSFTAVWPQFSSLVKILKGRGFSCIDETAKGAKLVSTAFANLIKEGRMDNIITTCCPAVNSLIEKEYGDLVGYMAPVVSPLIAHGRLLKKDRPDAKVVFLSPCIAKIKEIEDARFTGAVDAVISMEELYHWIENDLTEEETADWEDFEGSIARLYPTSGGIISTLEKDPRYKYVAIDGIHRVKEALESLRRGHMKGYFFEVNACQGSCLGGPLLSHFHHNEWLGQSVIRESIDVADRIKAAPLPVDLTAEWHQEEIKRPHHSEEEISAEMIREGKTSPAKIHDCGACGYETCRLKAIAVLDGKADPQVCLPMALERAQSLSNVVISNTPNGIIILDEDLFIREVNPATFSILGLETDPVGLPLVAILPKEELEEKIRSSGDKTESLRIYYEDYDKLIDHAIVNVQNSDYIVLILMDRTEEARKEKQMLEMRDRTLEVTQQVINEQMRAVQEIASLLGETTAKTKVALTSLKRSAAKEEDE
ncbi:MAG: 4Fe-4S binding protein [Erysipelotrichaceae bacterium]|nr:4Fe-4S binding protein [Erysipelotrichaceae bacterium]